MKKAKPSAGKTKRPQKMTKEELIATLIKKKQCNATALSVVEGLLESKISEQWLLSSLQYISQSHYQDAIEERAILKICGYPLCNNPLVNIPKQQFRISTQNNKVYDITERKNFCSNKCYRSSSFLKDQILTSPLWLRDIETAPDFKLLDGGTTRGLVGDEIDVGPTRVSAEEASLNAHLSENISEEISKTHSSDGVDEPHPVSTNVDPEEKSAVHNEPQRSLQVKEVQENDAKCTLLERATKELICQPDSASAAPESERCYDVCSIEKQFKDLKVNDETGSRAVQDCADLQNNPVTSPPPTHVGNADKDEDRLKNSKDSPKFNGTVSDDKSRARKQRRTTTQPKVPVVPVPHVSEFVEQRLSEWFTVDSVCFLYGKQRTREMLGEQSAEFDQNFKPLDSATWDPEKHERFVKICKRLNLLDIEDKSFDDKVISEDKNIEKKPLPDFNKLKEEAEKMDLRVRAFYKGQLELQPRTVTFAEGVKEGVEQELPVLPLVHQHEQRAVRRRLVLDALNKVLPDLLRTLSINYSHVNSVLRGLIGTFALTAVNITLSPRQWTLVAIVVIKLLAVRETRLNVALSSEASQKYLTLIQMSYDLSPTFLDQLVDRLVSNALFPAR